MRRLSFTHKTDRGNWNLICIRKPLVLTLRYQIRSAKNKYVVKKKVEGSAFRYYVRKQ